MKLILTRARWIAGFVFAPLILALPARALAQDVVIEALKKQMAEMQEQMKKMAQRIEQLEQEKSVQAEAAAAQQAPPASPPVQTSASALNPAISVVGNFVGRVDNQKVINSDGNRVDNRFNLREAEIDMRVPVDPYADGVLIASLESNGAGSFSAGVEEGYATIKKLPFIDEPPLGLKLKLGRFRPAFGMFNIFHTHDLPTTFRSLPTEEFMGEDGFIQDGLSGNFFVPTPWDTDSSLDATMEVLTGGEIAIAPESRSRVSYLEHLRWFRTFADVHNVQLGWSSYFRPLGNGVGAADFHGVDFLYRWKPIRLGEWKSFLFGGEAMFARRAYPNATEPADVERAIRAQNLRPGHGWPFGLSLFGQWQFNQRAYGGVRWDYTKTLYDPGMSRISLTPYLSYYLSEFLRARFSYEHRWSDFFTENKRNTFLFELNFIFGSHPPEPFWVNK
ncbi:MAG: hypothetical protein ACM3TN_28615 [Alphaproteobacteria bacterium]